jgi:predicted helicase
VFHAHLYGSQREVFEKNINGEKELSGGKYKYLWDNDITTTEWTELEPQTPYYLFSPQNIDLLKEFENGWSVTKAFPVNVLGFQTHRDDFAIAFDKETIKSRIQDLRDSNLTDQQIYERYKIANRDWKLAQARNELRSSANWEDALIKCSYRPFDERFCYFDSSVMDCPRRELLDHVAGKENLCFGLGRQGIAVNDPEWHLISISRHPIDANVFRRGGINLFPLYLYPTERTSLFDEGIVGRRPNFAPEFIAEFSTKLGLTFSDKGQVTGDEKTFTPEDVFYYAYAVFHSPEYRRRYAEFLKINFPRLPLTSDKELFRKLAALGERLTLLHLMEANMEPITGYPERGSDEVEFIKYEAASGSDSSPTVKEGSGDGALADARATDTGRVWINKEQYFSDVPEDVWNFHIGGYQVCQKWLKDRKGRTLSYDDLDHYQKIVASLKETIALMSRIDAAIERRGGYPFKQNRGRAD